jgi:hypothetical protein
MLEMYSRYFDPVGNHLYRRKNKKFGFIHLFQSQNNIVKFSRIVGNPYSDV